MKKILSIIALLMAFAAAGFAADKTVYLKPTAEWLSGARFAVHMFGSSDGETSWADVNTLATNETDIYKVVIPEKFTKIIFCRMDGATTENNWDNRWNQTQDITLTSDKDLYTITGWDTCDEGSTYTLATISSVSLTGDLDLALADGEEKVLDLSSTLLNKNFKLKVNNTEIGTNQLTLVDAGGLVTLGTNDGDNFTLKNNTSGYKTYTVKAEWAPSSNAAKNWTLTIAGQDARVLNYAIVGDWTTDGEGWNNDQPMTKDSENPSIYTLTINDFPVAFEAGQTKKTYYYKLRTNGIWGLYDLPNGNENKSKEFTEEGTYTLVFTANVSEHTLDMTAKKKPELPGEVLWEGEAKVMGWGPDGAISIAKEKFASAKIGDVLHISVEDTPGGHWDTQVSILDGTWTAIEENIFAGDLTQVSLPFTGDMLARIKANGLVVRGPGYSTSLITLEKNVYSGSEYSVWVGDQTLTWSQVEVNAIHFKHLGVEAGKAIRLTYEKTGDPNIQLIHDWYPGEQYGTPSYGEGTAILAVTEDMVENLSTKKLTINANGIRLKQIELVPFTDYYLVGGTNTWTVSENPMNEKNGVYSATIPYSSGYEFAIAPNTALNASNNAVVNWSATIRPESLTEVKFVNNSGTGVATSNSDQKWKMKTLSDNESLSFTALLTYNPETGAWTTSATSTITINPVAKYATYSNAQKFEVAEGPEVYIVKDASTNIKLTEPSSRILPGDRAAGIILKGSGDVTIKSVAADAETADVTGNLLVGSCDWSYTFPGNYSNIYLLANGNSGVGFYPWDTNATGDEAKLAAHKAFLVDPSGARGFIGFDDGETTTIEGIAAEKINNGEIYNLNGQRVAQPTKGLYIVNGKKVIVK